jgi:hypothetical protein
VSRPGAQQREVVTERSRYLLAKSLLLGLGIVALPKNGCRPQLLGKSGHPK